MRAARASGYAGVAIALTAGCLQVPPAMQASDTSSSDATHTLGDGPSSTGDGPTSSSTGSPNTGSATDTWSTATTSALDSSSSAGDPTVLFFDDFNRPDASEIGNDWTEKSPQAWAIVNERVAFQDATSGFANNFLFRTDIAVVDVEVSVEFRLSALTPVDFPQVHGRLDPDETAMDGITTSYGAFVDTEANQLEIIRSNGGGAGQGTTLTSTIFIPSLTVDTDYRLTLRISGAAPAELEATLERLGADVWQPNGVVAAQDNSAQQLTSGSAGTSGNLNIINVTYDNFLVLDPNL